MLPLCFMRINVQDFELTQKRFVADILRFDSKPDAFTKIHKDKKQMDRWILCEFVFFSPNLLSLFFSDKFLDRLKFEPK